MGTSTLQTRTIIASAWFAASALTGCGPEPVFPADYQQRYTEVRDCRRSGDHDLNYIRILADTAALMPYRERAEPFPVGSVVLKEEFADDGCTDLVGYTAMQKLGSGEAAEAGHWRWQKVSAEREVEDDGAPARCVGCHQACGQGGYDWTCAEP